VNPIVIAGVVFLLAVMAGASIYILDKLMHPDLAKESIHGPVEIVTDLDRLISNGVGFKWNGKVHVIKPMKNRTFLLMLNELGKMDQLNKSGIRDQREIVRAYARLFAVVCDTISFRDVEEMTQAQIRALFGQIMACVMGQAQVKEQEKKTVLGANPENPFASAQVS
jgi:hypothetical protein